MEASRPCLLSSLEIPRWPPTTFGIQSSMTLLPERIYAVQLARDVFSDSVWKQSSWNTR